MVPTFEVIIPWRTGSENRLRRNALTVVLARFAQEQVTPIVASADPWSPGAARNHGAALATGVDVLVFNDADTLVPHRQLLNAAEQAAAQPGLVYAYTLYMRQGPDGNIVQELFQPGSFGCVAISRQCFDRLEGFDEGFVGWGYEDLEFARRAAQLWPIRRVEGIATHLWHGGRNPDDSPDDANQAEIRLNEARWNRLTR